MIDFGYFNRDCMEGMKEIPDKFFDLALCDPPYGGGSQIVQVERERRTSRRISGLGAQETV